MNEEQNLNIYLVISRYLKMVIPSFGKFTNGMYDIVGVMWFGRLYGRCTKSRWNSVMNVGDWKNIPQYHLRSDTKPQFFK
jgi:hypothetical protein